MILTHLSDLQEQRKGSAWVQREILEEVEGEGDGEVEGEGKVEGEGEQKEKQFKEEIEDKEEEEESLVLSDFINNDPIVEQFQVYFFIEIKKI